MWSDQFWYFTPEQEADHLREKPEKQVGRSRAHRITDVRRTEPGPARTRSRWERQESLTNLVRIAEGGRPRRDPSKGVHLPAVFNGGAGVEEAERSDDILRGTDRGVLQQRRTSSTEGTILDEGGHPGDD